MGEARMSLENWEEDLAVYRAVLDDIDSGKLRLQQGQEEFVADLKRRIAALEEKIDGRAQWADRASDGEPGFAA
jgi:hypothetical protein